MSQVPNATSTAPLFRYGRIAAQQRHAGRYLLNYRSRTHIVSSAPISAESEAVIRANIAAISALTARVNEAREIGHHQTGNACSVVGSPKCLANSRIPARMSAWARRYLLCPAARGLIAGKDLAGDDSADGSTLKHERRPVRMLQNSDSKFLRFCLQDHTEPRIPRSECRSGTGVIRRHVSSRKRSQSGRNATPARGNSSQPV